MNGLRIKITGIAKLGLLLSIGWALVAALLATPAFGQSFFKLDDDVPDVLATFEAWIEPDVARPGEHVRLIVTGKIAEGWYTYSVVPQGGSAPPPTTLTVESGVLVAEGPVYETNPVVKKDKVFDMTLAFHPGAVRIYQNFRVPEHAAAGDVEVTGRLRYQVCNNRLCTPPTTKHLSAVLTVEEGPVRPPFAYMQRTVDFSDGQGGFFFSADSLEKALSGGFGAFLLIAVGFGLLALLTPCVFPMIPITVSFFTGAARDNRGGVGLALIFALGIIVSYTGLGLILTFFLGATGVSQFATNPWVNLVVAGFFTLFALSLMGVLGFALPASWVQGLDSKSRAVKGPVGVLLMGVAFAATSFTCTVPFVGTLLIAATQGQVIWPVVGMVVFATVFALPFFLLALFPEFLVKLRGRGGNWLVQLKVSLGLVELIAALKFASNADLVWQWGVLDRDVLLAVSGVIALLVALIVLGLLPWPGIKVQDWRAPRLAAGGLFLALAVYLGLGVTGRELDSYTESYLPPDLNLVAGIGVGRANLLGAEAVLALPWAPTLAGALERAATTGKPVFIDFTGYTCINCRWMEKKIFADKSVFRAFQERFELAQLYTDGGEFAEGNQKLQIERFRTIALPYYVILAPDNTVLATHAGIVPTPRKFLAWLDHGTRLTALVEKSAN